MLKILFSHTVLSYTLKCVICFINHTHFPSRGRHMITTCFTGLRLKGWAFIFFHLNVQSDYWEKHFHPQKFKCFVSECTGCNSQQHLLPICSCNPKFPFWLGKERSVIYYSTGYQNKGSYSRFFSLERAKPAAAWVKRGRRQAKSKASA